MVTSRFLQEQSHAEVRRSTLVQSTACAPAVHQCAMYSVDTADARRRSRLPEAAAAGSEKAVCPLSSTPRGKQTRSAGGAGSSKTQRLQPTGQTSKRRRSSKKHLYEPPYSFVVGDGVIDNSSRCAGIGRGEAAEPSWRARGGGEPIRGSTS